MKNLMLVGLVALVATTIWGDTTYTWVGASGGNWNDAANWSPNTGYPNAAGDVADFSGVTANATVAIPETVTVGKIIGNAGGTLQLGTFVAHNNTTIGITHASGTGDQPEISVPGSDSTVLYVACCFKGTQGYNKTGTGRLYQAAYSTKSYSGTSRISAGSVYFNPPTNANTEGRMGDNVEILKGGTLFINRVDTIGNAQPVHVKGGIYNMTVNDYVGDLKFSEGGLLQGQNWILPNARPDGTLFETTGSGYAGKITKRLVLTTRYSAQNLMTDYRTFIMRIADGTWLDWNFNFGENWDQNWDYANENFYKQADQSVYKGTAQLRKEGTGDLFVNNMSTSMSGPTTVIDGRIIFTNTVHWSGSTLVTTKSVGQVAFGKNATVNLSGLDASPTVAADTVDLNGATLKLGGFGKDAMTPAQFANGTVSKVGPNTQTLTSEQTQKDWKVIGGRLCFGTGLGIEPCVHFTYDDETDYLKDTGTAQKEMKEVGNIEHVAEGGRFGGFARINGGCAQADDAIGLPGGSSSFTFSTWIRTREGRSDFGSGSIIGYGDPAKLDGNPYGTGAGFRLNNWRFNGGNYCYQSFYGGDMAKNDANKLPDNIGDGNWHHYAMTYDSVTRWRSFYVDGVKVVTDKTLNANPDVNLADSPFMLGNCICAGSLTGDLDETMVFNVALDDNAIRALYQAIPGETRSAKLPSDATVTVGEGATVAFSQTDQTLAALNGAGDLELGDATLALAPAAGAEFSIGRLVGTGTLVKNGAGALRIRKGNRLGGTVKLNEGSLVVQGGGLTLDGMRDSIVGYWDFDDPNDMGKDIGPNNMQLSCPFARFRRSEETAGSAYHNHGGDPAMLTLAATTDLAKLPKGAEPYTLAAWVKPTVKNVGSIIQWGGMDGGKLCAFRFNNNDQIAVVGVRHSFYGGDWATDLLARDADFFADNAPSSWHHLAVSVSTTGRKLFLDGVCIATHGTGCSGKALTQEDFKICSYVGFIDDAAIFNRALTDEEMKRLPAGLGPVGGVAVDSAAGTTVTVESGVFGLKGGVFAGVLGGDGEVELSGELTVVSTTAIAPKKVTVKEDTIIRTAPGGTAAPVSSTEQMALPANLEVVVDLGTAKAGTCPLLHCANGFTGSTDGWTVTVVQDGKVYGRAVTTLKKTDQDISVQAAMRGLVVLIK